MVDVRFELTTNDPWSVDDAICECISPLGYWQKVNQSPTQTKPYNTLPPYPLRFVFCIFIARRFQLYLPSSTRVELCSPTLGALSR